MTDYQPPPQRSRRFERWPDAEYDAALHLLDRQIVDRDGRMVAKVDDVELSVASDGTLVATGLRVGLPALLPRFGPRLGGLLTRTHAHVHVAQADRVVPDVVDLAQVADVSSEVHLSVGRADLLRARHDGASRPERIGLADLLGRPVRTAGTAAATLHRRSQVLDVRLGCPPGGVPHQVTALLVGPGRPGALLGYDRSSEPGPWLVGTLVRWLHRHARVVELGKGVELSLRAGEVRIGEGASLLPPRG